jgi:hypothetical protein
VLGSEKGHRGRSIVVPGLPEKSLRPYLKNKLQKNQKNKKGLGA